MKVDWGDDETKLSFGKPSKTVMEGVSNYSQVPLSMVSGFGIVMMLLVFDAVVFIGARKSLFGYSVDGWASTNCTIVLIGGIQFVCMGIIGNILQKHM